MQTPAPFRFETDTDLTRAHLPGRDGRPVTDDVATSSTHRLQPAGMDDKFANVGICSALSRVSAGEEQSWHVAAWQFILLEGRDLDMCGQRLKMVTEDS